MKSKLSRSFYITFVCVLSISMMLASIFKTELGIEKQAIKVSFEDTSKTVLVIDAGHGGIDGGAVGVNGTVEKNINLDIALKCSVVMDLLGVDVEMTRMDDRSLHDDESATIAKKKVSDIKNRVKMVNDTVSPVLLSIHMNSFPDGKYSGAQVFYSVNDPLSKDMAEKIQEYLRLGLQNDNVREAKAADKGIYLLNNVNCPAVIVECGFLSNAEEEAKLNNNDYRKKTAASICAGVAEFLYGMAA